MKRWPMVAVVLTSLLFTLAVMGAAAYLLGLLHLLQAALALAVCVRAAGRPRSTAVSH